ncbi:AAA family ATPase [Plantibacter sp. lyk4-40-MEA-4]|uniref:AAA family ATPase n=1 Tax=Plantibacter sp. lyk4-40-MEA-4 TaxID=3040298 RepID=UPI0025516A2F|nr:AAA family ATPase [Plantibacter sp. lyk4-40-MEA-4]
MKIVVSGTHASGKSTLIADFALRHPEFTVLGEVFDLVEDAGDVPSSAMFAAQLRLSADRLLDESNDGDVIAERGPLDFLAYLLASAELSGTDLDTGFLERANTRAAAALQTVDVLVVLPLTPNDGIHVGADEDLELRTAMNAVLLDLVDDPDLIADHVTVAEIIGDPSDRLATLEALVASQQR